MKVGTLKVGTPKVGTPKVGTMKVGTLKGSGIHCPDCGTIESVLDFYHFITSPKRRPAPSLILAVALSRAFGYFAEQLPADSLP
jgi:hypothetical protein